jgi:hypothetical protein
MRRVALIAVALAIASVGAGSAAPAGPAGSEASLSLGKQRFSPVVGTLAVRGALPRSQPVGIELATRGGKRVGWIAPPAWRASIALDWDGRIVGRVIPDGRYVVRLVVRGRALAARPVRIDRVPIELDRLRIGNGNRPYVGDGPLLATVSPNGDGLRDRAIVRFRLHEPALVTLEVTRTRTRPVTIFKYTKWFRAGARAMYWKPPATINTRTYMTRLTTKDPAGNELVYGADTAWVGRYPRAPVVRIQGIDAGSTEVSYAPGQLVTVRISTDAPSLSYQIFQSGPEREIVYADNQMAGIPVPGVQPVGVDWRRRRNRPHTVSFRVGNWPSGLYYASFTAPDGRIGYAPFVVRPTSFGASSRVAVVLPTNTWQAYNFWDANGNGYGDTWYAGAPNYSVDLARPYIARGAPPRFYRYDLPFLHWFYWGGRSAEFFSDSDFAQFANGDALAALYDLVVFPGHEEYVTQHMYDVVERYRDLGGNLIFLSANNFFWRVRQTGTKLRKAALFRQLGRPEARILGVQYRANDNGQRQGVFTVTSAATAPWLWAGTGLRDGSTFGQAVGGYGIEIDAMTPDSPPGTIVLAHIPDLLGPGLTAQMTYYESPAGAKVFAAGTLDFGGSATYMPMRRMLDNLWARLSVR